MRPSPFWSERAASCERSVQPFEAALAATRAGNVFTTHTAVPAGFDRFAPELIEQYSRALCAGRAADLPAGTAGAGSREPEGRLRSPSTWPIWRMRGCARGQRRQPAAWRGQPAHLSAAVPALAGRRSADRSHHQWRAYPELGQSPAADALWTEACGKDRWLGALRVRRRAHSRVLPTMRRSGNAARPRAGRSSNTRASGCRAQLAASGGSAEEIEAREASVQSGNTDTGFCAPVCDLQAPESAAARSRAPGCAC